MTARGYTKGELLDSTDCEILIETGASKSYMSQSYFLRCKNLHVMPKFMSTNRRIQVGNGQYVGVLFVIPVIITIQKHRFEIFTLVSEIHENVDLVLGIKNLFELEGVMLEAPFVEEISGMAITKMLDTKEQMALTMKLKFIRNRAMLKVTNSTHDIVTFNPTEMLGVIDLRSFGVLQNKARSPTAKFEQYVPL